MQWRTLAIRRRICPSAERLVTPGRMVTARPFGERIDGPAATIHLPLAEDKGGVQREKLRGWEELCRQHAGIRLKRTVPA
jgi:hypothetical protein